MVDAVGGVERATTCRAGKWMVLSDQESTVRTGTEVRDDQQGTAASGRWRTGGDSPTPRAGCRPGRPSHMVLVGHLGSHGRLFDRGRDTAAAGDRHLNGRICSRYT